MKNRPDLRVQVMARGAFQIVEVKRPLRQPFVCAVRVVTLQAPPLPVFSAELGERNAVMGIVAGIADFLRDLSVKAFRVLPVYLFVTFTALGFDPHRMWELSVLLYERYGVMTGRAMNPILRVGGPGEFHRIDEKIPSFSGFQILPRMTFQAFIVRRELRL
jgi:hypothetical protein